MKLILWLLVLILCVSVAYDTIADATQRVIASNSGATWAPSAQKYFAWVSYVGHKNRVAREAYAMSLKLFPKETDQPVALYRIAKASERLLDYKSADKFYKKLVTDFPNSPLAATAKERLADIEGVYLEFVN